MQLAYIFYQLKRVWHFFKTALAQSLPAMIKTAFPQRKLQLIAITGTDGKTTSAHLCHHLLKEAGYSVGLISTVACKIGEESIETGLHVTSPQPRALYRMLREMVAAGTEYLVLEVTSHGEYQHRTFGLSFSQAGITNLSHEHLDYHLDMENYLEAKAMILKRASRIVLNEDDEYYQKFRQALSTKKEALVSYGKSERLSPQLQKALNERFPEAYNQMNARLVLKLLAPFGIGQQELIAGIRSFPGTPGRMEEIPNRRQLKVIVDFAHTPNGLKKALQALQPKKGTGRLIAVLGAAGERDFAKRPAMGRIVSERADLVIFTSEDPRSEDPWSIINQLKSDLGKQHGKVLSIVDRREAIRAALNTYATAGDCVVILGKGPEKSLAIGRVEFPWSDAGEAEKALKEGSA